MLFGRMKSISLISFQFEHWKIQCVPTTMIIPSYYYIVVLLSLMPDGWWHWTKETDETQRASSHFVSLMRNGFVQILGFSLLEILHRRTLCLTDNVRAIEREKERQKS